MATVLTDVEQMIKELEGKTVEELEALHAEALVLEADAKKELTVVRQRVANMAADAKVEGSKLIADAEAELQKADLWLKALIAKLGL